MAEDQLIHIIYNTGDQIWLTYVDGHQKVVRVIAHDGVYWESGMTSLGRVEDKP